VANHHFANVGDVWKHLWLAGALSEQRPEQYVETHAGSARYRLVDDAERQLGVRTFMTAAANLGELRSTAYFGVIGGFVAAEEPSYPGSALLAMTMLGAACRYCFCDTDPVSVKDLVAAATRLGLRGTTQVLASDGVSAVLEMVEARQFNESAFVHVDPFDFDSTVSGGVSARELIKRLAAARVPVFAWYHLASPTASLELFRDIAAGVPDTRVTCAELRLDGPKAGIAGTGCGCGVLLVGDQLASAMSAHDEAAIYVAAFNDLADHGGLDVTAISDVVMA
jgi:23S rRNA A2030 N6-methylase RlmJ